MDMRNIQPIRPALVLAGAILAWGSLAAWPEGSRSRVWADDPPTTQTAESSDAKAADDKPGDAPAEKPGASDDELTRMKAAAIASRRAGATSQPAKSPIGKPSVSPAGLNSTKNEPTSRPTVVRPQPKNNSATAGGKAPFPGRPQPGTNSTRSPVGGSPMNPALQTPSHTGQPANVGQPARGAGQPDGRNPRPGPPNPRGPQVPHPGVTPVSGSGPVTPTAGGTDATAGEGEATTAPVVTNTKTKMLVFQIEDPHPEERTYRFQYVDMPWGDVLSDFSRVSGLPLVNKPDPPIAGNLTYFSNDEYTFEEALHKLNELILLPQLNNYVIQRKPKYLSVERIPDLVRKIPPENMFNTFEEFEAAHLDPYDVCLVKIGTPPNWSAFEVIEQFRAMFSDTYGTEIVGENLIQLTGLVKEHMLWKEVVSKLALMPPPRSTTDQPHFERKLKSQKAVAVQGLLMQLYGAGAGGAPKARPGSPPTIDVTMQEQKTLTIVPDVTNNVIYARGPQYLLDEITATLDRIDVGELKLPQTEYFKLQSATANSIVTTLKPIFQKMMADLNRTPFFIPEDMKASMDVDIYPDNGSNAIIIVGGEEGRAQAMALIKQYDVPTEWVTEIITLKHAKSDAVMGTLQNALQRLMAGKVGAQMVPQVLPQTSSTLLISCTPSDLKEIESLLEKIDVPDVEELHEHILTLEYARPSEAAQTVTQILSGTSGGSGGTTVAPRVFQPPVMRGKPGQPGQTAQQMQQMQAMRQQQMMANAGGGGGAGGPLLIPDDDAGTLMVYCADKDWERIDDLVKKLDAQAGTVLPMLHTIELKKANPEDVAAMVNSMFPATPGSSSAQIVTADIFNNTIQIFATPSFVEKVVPLIETLDINATAELTVIKLEHCKADVIAPILAQGIPGAQAITTPRANVPTPNMPQQRQPVRAGMPQQVAQRGDTSVRIVAEPITNSLLVTAPPKELEQIQKLVQQMEKVGEGYDVAQVIVEAQHRPAEELATTLSTLLGSGPANAARAPGQPAVAGELNPSAEQLKVVSNGDRLILKGPQNQIAEALQIIDRIDVADQTPIARQYAVNDAETDEQKLRTMLAGRVAAAGSAARPMMNRPTPGRPVQAGQNIQQVSIPTQGDAGIQVFADTYQNTLLIRALPKEFTDIEAMLKVILSDPPDTTITNKTKSNTDQFFMVRLKHKSAWDMSFILDDLVNKDGRTKVEFLEGPTKNEMLVMNYKPGQEENIRKYIEMFDVSDSPGSGKVRMYDLESKMTAAQVEAYFQLQGGQTKSGKQIKFVKSDDEGRVQVIDIHAGEAVEEESTPESDAAPSEKPSDSEKALEPAKSSNSGAAPTGPTSSARPVRLSPLQFPLSVMFETAARAVAQVAPSGDEKTPASSEGRGFRIESVTPVVGVGSDQVQIIQDPDTGRLMLIGPEEEIDEIIEILDELKDEESPMVVRVFPLKYADVNTAAQTLNQVFNQQAAPQPQQRGRGQAAQQQGGPPQIDPKTGQPMPQAQQPPTPQVAMPQPGGRGGASGGAMLKVVPEERTKSLFVVARQADLPLIIEVLRQIDSSVIDKKNLRFFRLQNLQAEEVVENLKEILGIESSPAARGRGRPGQPGQPQNQGGEQQIVGLPGAQGAATVSADKIKLTAETQTNTVIAQAPPDTLDLIGGLIEELEKLTNITKWEMRRVELKHARATDIADIVDDLARELLPGGGGQQGQPQMQGGPGGRGGRRAGVNRVLVEADSRTNSVIIAGQMKDLDVCAQIIKDLDVDEGDNAVRQFTVKGLPSELVPALKELFVSNRGGGRGGENTDIIITANDATKTILVKAPAPQMEEIEKQISEMDAKVESAQTLRTIKLAVANAETVATKLTEVFASQAGRGRAQGDVTIKGVKTNSTLYVRCPDDLYKSIESIARSMDTAPSDVQVRRFALKNAVAQDVHQRIQQLMATAVSSRSDLNLDLIGLTPDPRTNSLVLVGGPTSIMLLESLLGEVDVAPETPMVRATTAYTLPAGQDVNQVVNNINQMFQGVNTQTSGVEAPRVTANASANLVIVEANSEQQKKIKEGIIDPILNNVDQRKDFIYQVKNAQATQLAGTLMTQLRTTLPMTGGRPAVNITGDDGANTLLINASDKDYATVTAMIDKLDVEPKDRVTQAFKVKYVAPWTMANIINQQYGTATRNPNERVTAAFEDGTMSIIVTANAKNIGQVAKLIEETDKPGQKKETRFLQVKQARADDLQRALDASLRGRMPVQRSGQYPFNITADPSSNVLVVTAETDLFPDIEDLVKQLDVAPMGTDAMVRRTIKLTYADPGAVANNIRQGFQTTNRNPSPRDVVIAAENWTTNSVFVVASEENMAKIDAIIADMDRADGSGTRIEHILEVTNANPNDIAQAVQAVFQDVYRNRRQQTPPTIKAIPGTTKIIAYANEDEIKQIRGLIEKVDTEGGRIVHTVTMPEQVPARTVADNINQLFGSRGGPAGDGPKAQYHEPTNTVLVSATDAEFAKIEKQLIEPLSQSPGSKVLNFYKIPLKYAVADEVAKTLQEFFDKKSGISQNRNLPPWMRTQSSSEAQDNQVTVMAETGSNTLLIYATETTKKLIDDLVEDIDQDRSIGQSMQMVALQYVDAKEMLEVMTEVLKVQKRTPSDQNSRFIPWWMDGQQEKEDDKTVLAGDMRLKAVESSNSIIVSGKKESVDDAVSKIKELDIPTTGDTPMTYTVVNGTSTDKVEVLKKLFVEGRDQARGSTVQKLTIVADEGANQILVKGKTSEVNAVLDMAKQLDQSMDAGSTGVQIVEVPLGQNVETLARDVQDHINEMERNKAQRMQGYKADLVTITANTRANVLLVSASKANLEEVKKTVNSIVQRGPQGGLVRRVIQLSPKLSPQQVQQLINQMNQQGQGGSGARPGGRPSGGRGPRGDAAWSRDRRYERMLNENPAPAKPSRLRKATTVAATMPIFMMQFALSTAVAQAPATKKDESNKPKVHTIRPKAPTSQPAARRAAMHETPSRQPVVTRGMSLPDSLRGTTQPSVKPAAPLNQVVSTSTQPADFNNWSQAAKDAFQLTGAEVSVTEAGPGMIVLEGVGSDLDTIEQLLSVLEQSVPDKHVEYFRLKNASATDLAQTLQQVFQKIESQGAGQALPSEKVDIIPDSRTNGLYVAASDAKMQTAAHLIAQADERIDTSKTFKSFPFKNRRVAEVGDVLKGLVKSYLKQKGLNDSIISIETDPQTNTVFITAGDNDLEFVTGLVDMLDAPLPDEKDATQEGGPGRADIMVVPLRVAKADTLATLLSGLLQKAATGDTPMKDFIRRLRLLNENGLPLATVDLNKPIFVFGDPDSNALIIASTIENCLIMKQVAKAFDKEPAKAEVSSRVFTLQYADAEEVSTRLNEMLTDSEKLTARPGQSEAKGVPDGQPGALVYKAVVKSDPRTNQVVVVGRPEAVETFESLIKALDIPGRGVMPFEIVRLEFASPSALATALTEMLDKRKEAIPGSNENVSKSETVIITPDARSQSLIIAAKHERMEELKGLIKQLDIKASALVENIRTITLRKSNANDLAEKLKDLWTQTRDQREGGDAGGLGFEIPAIVADERSNSLIVSASLSDFESIKGVVDKIENLELNPMANIYIVRMKYNSASQLSSALQSLFQARAEMASISGEVRPEDKVSIEVDEATNSLLVAASRTNYDVLMEKVKELDVEVGVMGQIEFFACDNISAGAVKDVVDQLFEGKLYKPGSTGTGEGADAREKVTCVIDDRANVLVVTASPENMSVVREVHQRMNSVTTPWDAAITKLIQLEHGDCVQIADQVQKYFDELKEVRDAGGTAGSSSSGSRWIVKIIADEKRNRLIVGGSKDGIDRAVELIAKMDVPPGEPNQVIKVYKVNEAPAQKIGEIITNIFQERNQPRQGATGGTVPDIKVTVETNDAARTIVVNASKLDHILVENLIRELDRPSALLDMVKVFPLVRARAAKVKDILDEVYQSAQSGGSSGGQTVAVVADERTNSVVVAAPPGELSNVETIIGRLDQADINGIVEVGIYPCENEDASKMADILNQIMMGQGGSEGGGGATDDETIRSLKSKAVAFRGKEASGEEKVLQSLRENVQISFNVRSNSVIVVAPPDTLRLIKELIHKLDGIQKKEVLVKVFMLRHADATKTVDILEKMFAQDESSGDQAEFQQGREMTVEGGAGVSGASPTAFSQGSEAMKGTFGKPKTTFVPDERTNSIVAAGWPEDISVAADILDQIDSTDVQDRESFVYTAVNMKAVDMQSSLDSYFQAEKGIFDSVESVSPQQKMERDVSIIAHEESNQLIVSVSPRQKSRVMSIIEQIDAPPAQVMIQVMIAEVTIDDRFEMGLEFALQELRFSETAVPGGNGVLQSSHFDVVGGTDLGAAGSGLGGFSFTITGEDFNFLVRALQSDSRLEVIQRPMIMCQDNQVANISIGQEVPIPQSTGQTTGGTVQTSVTYQQVGIILDVEPNINPDGWVYLKVAPEVSDVADSTIQVGPGVFAPIFTNRSAETFVAVKDGETVVIGGLITTSSSESESKVPLLGDVPGLGALFRTTTRTKRKTELLIALTPRIVRTVEDGYRMSIEERDKSGIITDEMKSSPFFEKLRLTPESEDEIGSIEELAGEDGAGPSPASAPAEPTRIQTPSKEKKYGPEVPHYGPVVPSETDDDVIARRTSKPLPAHAAQ